MGPQAGAGGGGRGEQRSGSELGQIKSHRNVLHDFKLCKIDTQNTGPKGFSLTP